MNADRLAASGLPGRVVACIDVLHEGPAPGGVEGPAWRELRAGYFADRGCSTREWALARLEEADAALDAARAEDEIVLWFEHDLVCQLMMIRLLDRLRRTAAPVVLICIGEYPGVPSFRAVGDLAPGQIVELFDRRTTVASRAVEVASAAWSAFRAPDPTALVDVSRHVAPELPFLAPALRRQLAQLPATQNGLGRTEQLIVDRLAEGPVSRRELFVDVQARETTPFMTDLLFFGYVDDLIRNRLVAPVGESVRLTPVGRDVQTAALDAIDVRGIDRWFGGVRLTSPPAPDCLPVWRWDAPAGRLERV